MCSCIPSGLEKDIWTILKLDYGRIKLLCMMYSIVGNKKVFIIVLKGNTER